MKVPARIGIGILLLTVGAGFLAYSYTLPYGQIVLFDQNSIQLGTQTYVDFQVVVNIDGKYSPSVAGSVGSLGCCVDFYLVNDSSWNSWATNSSSRTAYSEVHLNSTEVSSQSAEGEFSFNVFNTTRYNIVFVNDAYPNASTARSHASIILQYTPALTVYFSLGSLTTLGIGLTWLVVLFVRSRIKMYTPPSEATGPV
jgi:hypothetical protein